MTNTDTTAIGTLDVLGARLHYETRGSGPTLLLIPGGPMDGAAFSPVVPPLAADYRVATFDPRGLSRSTREDTEEERTTEIQADDVHHLLAALGKKSAYVFASSGGAVTALELVIRHPAQIHTLVVHEPPVTERLPDSAQRHAQFDEVCANYSREGVGAAMAAFLAGADMATSPAGSARQEPPDPRAREVMAKMRANLVLFFEHMIRAITRYRPDVAALRNVSTRIVVSGGTDSAGRVAQRSAVALAEQLSRSLLKLPGGHGGSPPDRRCSRRLSAE
jgi:pimeloyl-ACP methyl ester carboxylesterase